MTEKYYRLTLMAIIVLLQTSTNTIVRCVSHYPKWFILSGRICTGEDNKACLTAERESSCTVVQHQEHVSEVSAVKGAEI